MGKKFWVLLTTGALVVVAAGGAGAYVFLQGREKAAQQRAADGFAHAWETGGLSTIGFAEGDAATIAKQVQTATAQVTSAGQDRPSSVTVGSVDESGGEVTATLNVAWTLTGDREWNYETRLPLRESGGDWRPVYQPSVLHPELVADGTLRTTTQDAQRGRILGAGDEVLVSERPVVVVGIQPGRADSPRAAALEVARIVGVNDTADLVTRVQKAGKDDFVQVITLREAAYRQVRDRLQPIPGAVFQERTLALAPSSGFARALLGSVGPATADIVKASENRVQAGQTTGLSGVQRQFDEQLSGQAGLTVQMRPKSGAAVDLFTAEPTNGEDLKLTLDKDVQLAAEKALRRATKPAALVAVKAGTGEILAVGNGGPGAEGYNRALLGQYPPGSTFKVVSGLSMLENGLTAGTTINCPATITVSGRTFKNAEDEVLGPVNFRSDFAHSCNTAFIGSASKVSTDDLKKTAQSLGFGRKNQVGVEAYQGQVPTSDEPVAHAASMIGQGQVLASPLNVAAASAAVAGGKWTAPHLVQGADVATGTLPADKIRTLRTFMRAVVTEGTATVMRNTPGGPVYGKTGTAEFGNDSPPKTHAWFTGYQGDVAFAVVVEDGGFGAETAAPIAKAFLTDLS